MVVARLSKATGILRECPKRGSGRLETLPYISFPSVRGGERVAFVNVLEWSSTKYLGSHRVRRLA